MVRCKVEQCLRGNPNDILYEHDMYPLCFCPTDDPKSMHCYHLGCAEHQITRAIWTESGLCPSLPSYRLDIALKGPYIGTCNNIWRYLRQEGSFIWEIIPILRYMLFLFIKSKHFPSLFHPKLFHNPDWPTTFANYFKLCGAIFAYVVTPIMVTNKIFHYFKWRKRSMVVRVYQEIPMVWQLD